MLFLSKTFKCNTGLRFDLNEYPHVYIKSSLQKKDYFYNIANESLAEKRALLLQNPSTTYKKQYLSSYSQSSICQGRDSVTLIFSRMI